MCVRVASNVGIAIKAQFSVVRPGKKTGSFLWRRRQVRTQVSG